MHPPLPADYHRPAMTHTPVVIAVLGAESTGKTALAQALAARLAAQTSLRVAWVPELLREWCDEHGRTPQADEQAGIARAQQARIAAAGRFNVVLVCDTTALMTAVYSQLIFGDESLHAYAVEQQRSIDWNLLMALDIPWVADGLQRDGPQVREPVDRAIRRLLTSHQLPWSLVSGQGAARVDSALRAVTPLLQRAGSLQVR